MDESKTCVVLVGIVAVVAVFAMLWVPSQGTPSVNSEYQAFEETLGGAAIGYACVDSDGGNNPDVYGVVTKSYRGRSRTYKDSCYGNRVKEYYCVGTTARARYMTCPSGVTCAGGACQSSTCTPTTEVCDGKDNDCDDQVDEGGVCTPTAYCGNAILESGEQCDHGANNSACPADCSVNCTWNNCTTGYPCTETDGGYNLYVKGYISGNNEYGIYVNNSVESCINYDPVTHQPRGVHESYCQNNIVRGSSVYCPTGLCANGACINQTQQACGNGIIETGEECDWGLNNGPCPATCGTNCSQNNCHNLTPE